MDHLDVLLEHLRRPILVGKFVGDDFIALRVHFFVDGIDTDLKPLFPQFPLGEFDVAVKVYKLGYVLESPLHPVVKNTFFHANFIPMQRFGDNRA
jgi:hypothetical protein